MSTPTAVSASHLHRSNCVTFHASTQDLAAREQFCQARTEPLITLGSAPLGVSEFRAVVLGQLGEARLDVAIEADLAGPMAHAKALDVDAQGALRDVHRRVGTTVLFESSGGQVDKVAHLPELRFALGELEVDTSSRHLGKSTARACHPAARVLRRFAGFAAESGWSCTHVLAEVPPVRAQRWLDEAWLRNCLRTHLVDPIRTTPSVLTESGSAAAPIRDNTTIIGARVRSPTSRGRCNQLRTQIDDTTSDYDRE